MMKRVQLGESDLQVSPICIGTWQFNRGKADINWEKFSDQEAREVVERAIENGINFFDTAEGYTNSEDCLGMIFEGRRRDVVLASKYGYKGGKTLYRAEDIEKAVTESLRSLRTDYIDIYQIHWPILVADFEETVNELKRQQAKGRIRYYSMSNFGCQNLDSMLEAHGQPLTNQVPYNLLWRTIESEVLPKCNENNIAVLAYSPLQQGLLSGKFLQASDVPEGRRRTRHFSSTSTPLSRHGQPGAEAETFKAIKEISKICNDANIPMAATALSWLLKQKGVASVITGVKTPEQVDANCKILDLSEDTIKKLSTCTDALNRIFGKELDMYAAESRSK